MASRGATMEIRKARRRVRPVAIPDALFGAPAGSLPWNLNRLSGLAGTSSWPFPMSVPASSAQATGALIRLFGVKGAILDSTAMEVPGATQRRRISRRRVFKGAQISFRGLRAAIDCTIHDILELGARLVVESPIGVPVSIRSGSKRRRAALLPRRVAEGDANWRRVHLTRPIS